MKAITAVLREVFGLFVDDGSLAVALLLWIGIMSFATHALALDRAWGGPVLAAGCLAILLENVRRSAR